VKLPDAYAESHFSYYVSKEALNPVSFPELSSSPTDFLFITSLTHLPNFLESASFLRQYPLFQNCSKIMSKKTWRWKTQLPNFNHLCEKISLRFLLLCIFKTPPNKYFHEITRVNFWRRIASKARHVYLLSNKVKRLEKKCIIELRQIKIFYIECWESISPDIQVMLQTPTKQPTEFKAMFPVSIWVHFTAVNLSLSSSMKVER